MSENDKIIVERLIILRFKREKKLSGDCKVV